ncbi:MAG: cupin domain-containing protein [Actinomycetota bacterium]|nr:cupin domain-containing protein [Actinomycetota bacterium]
MIGWVDDIESATLSNSTFRTVLFTGTKMQLTVMRIAAGEEIGVEMHEDVDQFIRIEQGRARVTFGPSEKEVSETHHAEGDWAVIIPAGTWHNVINAGDADLRLYSLYSPPEHPHGTVHETKAEADAAEAAHNG